MAAQSDWLVASTGARLHHCLAGLLHNIGGGSTIFRPASSSPTPGSKRPGLRGRVHVRLPSRRWTSGLWSVKHKLLIYNILDCRKCSILAPSLRSGATVFDQVRTNTPDYGEQVCSLIPILRQNLTQQLSHGILAARNPPMLAIICRMGCLLRFIDEATSTLSAGLFSQKLMTFPI